MVTKIFEKVTVRRDFCEGIEFLSTKMVLSLLQLMCITTWNALHQFEKKNELYFIGETKAKLNDVKKAVSFLSLIHTNTYIDDRTKSCYEIFWWLKIISSFSRILCDARFPSVIMTSIRKSQQSTWMKKCFTQQKKTTSRQYLANNESFWWN